MPTPVELLRLYLQSQEELFTGVDAAWAFMTLGSVSIPVELLAVLCRRFGWGDQPSRRDKWIRVVVAGNSSTGKLQHYLFATTIVRNVLT